MTFDKAKQILRDITNGKSVFDGILNQPLDVGYGNQIMIYIVKTLKGDFFPIMEYEVENLKKIEYYNGKLIAENVDNKDKQNWTVVN